MRGSCAQAARGTRLAVLCPAFVPAEGVIPGLYGPQLVDRGSYTISIDNGENPGHIHWEFGAARGGAASSLWVFDRRDWASLPPKPAPRTIGEIVLLGYPMTLMRFPRQDGQLAGHDVAVAVSGGVTYFASLHGYGHDDGDLAVLLGILLGEPAPRPVP